MRPILATFVLLCVVGCEGVAGDSISTPGAGGGPSSSPTSPTGPTSPTSPLPTMPTTPTTPTSPVPLPDVVSWVRFDCTPASGPSPVAVSCTFQARHSSGKPLTCQLDPGDGSALMPLEDCASEHTTSLTFAKVGTFTIVATAKDAAGVMATKSASVVVSPPPNQVPVIAAFTASPAQGGAPLTTTLSFAVSDPDGDPLTCAIDVGADGTDEYPQVDCAKGTQAHTVMQPGAVDVQLTVKDSRGGVATAKLTLTAKQAVGDLKVSKVEWGQSVIGSDTMRLVGSKAALLRVYVLADKAGLAGVTVDAEGFDAAGASLGKLTVQGPATPPTSDQPADLTQQYRATVPPAWMSPGLQIKVSVDPADALPETDETNNVAMVKPVVGKGNVMELTPVPVVHQGQTAGMPTLEPLLTRLWPLKGVNAVPRAPYTFSGTLTGGDVNAWGQLLQEIASVRQSDGSKRNYYGFVKVSYGSGIAGIGYIGQDAATGRDDSLETGAHELGHNMGRNHAPCGGAAGADPNFPYAGAKIGSWGYDSATGKLVNPATSFDLMSYCNPTWVSDYNYKAVQTFLEAQAFVVGGGTAAYEPSLLVAGSVSRGQVTLRPVLALRGTPSQVVDSSLHARLLMDDGREVVVPLQVSTVADADAVHFQAVVPAQGSARAIQILDGAKVVAEQVASLAPTAPSLERLDASRVRVRWDSTLAPTAQVAHFDAAGHRTTLALWLTGGDAVVRTDGLSGGHFEVSASDGVATARSELDLPAAP